MYPASKSVPVTAIALLVLVVKIKIMDPRAIKITDVSRQVWICLNLRTDLYLKALQASAMDWPVGTYRLKNPDTADIFAKLSVGPTLIDSQ